MTTKSDFIGTTLNPLHQKFSSNDTLSTKNSTQLYKKSTGLLSSLSTNKSGTFFHNDINQESTPYSNTYTAISHSALLNGGHKKSPVKSLVIDTNNESSKYNNTQNSIFGSYSTTHNNSNSYNFSKGALTSGLTGNLTTKFSRGNETYKSTFVPSVKSQSTSRLLLGTTNFSYATTQPLKDTTSTVVNSMNDHLSPPSNTTQIPFKNISTKNYSNDLFKTNQFESNQFDGKNFTVPIKSSHNSTQQENMPEKEQSSSTGNNRNDMKNTKHHSEFHDENMNTKTSTNNNLQQTATTARKLQTPLPNHEPTKCSVKRNGIVKAYAANTNQGIVRNYNEDRVSIILNIMKPASRVNEDWPKCSFFGVYDGHGGVNCADFLRDNLHQFVIKCNIV